MEICHKVVALKPTPVSQRGSCENEGSTEMESEEKSEKMGEEKQMESARRIQRPICLKYLDDLMRFD